MAAFSVRATFFFPCSQCFIYRRVALRSVHYNVASENSSRTRSLDDALALHARPSTQARPIKSLARRPELGSPKKGLGADDQIGDHPRRDRPRELSCVSLGWTVSTHDPPRDEPLCETANRTEPFFFVDTVPRWIDCWA